MGSSPPMSPMEQARILMAQKDKIEAEITTQSSILSTNSATLHSPLIDAEGFPRNDIDIYAVRNARVRIIELRNDLNAVMGAIGKALEGVYDPTVAPSSDVVGSGTGGAPSSVSAQESERAEPMEILTPFAKVNGVAPGSPAAEAVRLFIS